MGDRMTTIDDLARVERELREQAQSAIAYNETVLLPAHYVLEAADTIAAFIAGQKSEPETELGPWRADGHFIYSANFDHDAMLTVNGNFGSAIARDEFAKAVAKRLNAATRAAARKRRAKP